MGTLDPETIRQISQKIVLALELEEVPSVVKRLYDQACPKCGDIGHKRALQFILALPVLRTLLQLTFERTLRESRQPRVISQSQILTVAACHPLPRRYSCQPTKRGGVTEDEKSDLERPLPWVSSDRGYPGGHLLIFYPMFGAKNRLPMGFILWFI
jgi:hypothetical protein